MINNIVATKWPRLNHFAIEEDLKEKKKYSEDICMNINNYFTTFQFVILMFPPRFASFLYFTFTAFYYNS